MTRENIIRLKKIRNTILDEFYKLCKNDLKFSNFKEDLYEKSFTCIIVFEGIVEVEVYYNYDKYEYCLLNIESIDFSELYSVSDLKDFFNNLYNVSYSLYK